MSRFGSSVSAETRVNDATAATRRDLIPGGGEISACAENEEKKYMQ